MASSRQTSLTQVEWEGRARRTRRAEFLDQMDSVVPWADLLALVEPPGPTAGRRGRQPWPAKTLPGMHLVQCWPDLSDAACEDACYDSLSVRDFVGCWDGVPDATTLEDFRHLLEENDVAKGILASVVARLEAAGLVMRGGSVVDATIMEAPSSTKNASGSRDPETRLAKRGNQWHFGTRCHPGKDAGGGHADAGWRGARQARGGPLGPAPLRDQLARRDGSLRARGRTAGPPGRARGGAEPRPPCARGQAPLPDRQAHLRLREGALPRHREEGERASPPCPPAPTCPCAPGPGGRGSSWGPPWRPPDGGRGDGVPRGRPEGPREGPDAIGKAAAVRI